MEKEISSGTMLGIVLIALAAVIGLGFGVFSIAKSVANEGTVGVQDNLNTVSDSAFDDYNDKVVTGTMVKSAVQNFNGKSVAVLINTTAMDKGVVTYSKHTAATVVTLGTKVYVNYNALLGSNAKGTKVTKTDGTADGLAKGNASTLITLGDGVYTSKVAFELDESGKVAADTSIGGFSRTGNCEYISPSAKFAANLIRDTSGTTVGVVFEQMAR
ncbi:MAG: hypothetical protein RR313_00235 [Anaerovoracaceae bacterium]